MKYLPSVTNARYLKDFILEVKFDDGSKKTIDFSKWLNGEIFEPLRKKAVFRKFFLDGTTIAWPNGADIAPETLYEAEAVDMKGDEKLALTPLKRRKSA